MLRRTTGITLVALMVTIIVLLILAMVSVSLVIRGNIIEKANLAVTEYGKAAREENTALDELENQINNYIKTDGPEPVPPADDEIKTAKYYTFTTEYEAYIELSSDNKVYHVIPGGSERGEYSYNKDTKIISIEYKEYLNPDTNEWETMEESEIIQHTYYSGNGNAAIVYDDGNYVQVYAMNGTVGTQSVNVGAYTSNEYNKTKLDFTQEGLCHINDNTTGQTCFQYNNIVYIMSDDKPWIDYKLKWTEDGNLQNAKDDTIYEKVNN